MSSHATAGPPPAKDKVKEYEGGVYFITDGGVTGGPCFRLTGKMFSPSFFTGLKRIDGKQGTAFRRGLEKIAEFPDELQLGFSVRDSACPENIVEGGARKYLTKEWMDSLRVSFSWKRGVHLRTVGAVREKILSVESVEPLDLAATHGLPERFVWTYSSIVETRGVPLTDHLVIVLRTPEGKVVARVAARM